MALGTGTHPSPQRLPFLLVMMGPGCVRRTLGRGSVPRAPRAGVAPIQAPNEAGRRAWLPLFSRIIHCLAGSQIMKQVSVRPLHYLASCQITKLVCGW
jgi:hypothetical protein